MKTQRSLSSGVQFERFFLKQINQLARLGCLEEIATILKLQQFPVLAKARETGISEGNIPFIPVIPPAYRSIYDQMNSVFPNGHRGFTELNPTAIVDVEKTPNRPYYIFDVDFGTSLLGRPPRRARQSIKHRGRFPLTAAEIISVALLAKPPPGHFLHAPGSRYGSANKILTLYQVGASPRLGWVLSGEGHPEWGTPSCARRF